MIKKRARKCNFLREKISAVVNLCLAIECPVYDDKQYKCTKYNSVKACHLIKECKEKETNKVWFKHKELQGTKEIEINKTALFTEKYCSGLVSVLAYLNKQYFKGNNDNKI